MEALAARHPDVQWRWLDIEDEAELMDSVGLDVETIPTVLLGRGEKALYLGAIAPQADVLGRLSAQGAAPAVDVGTPAAQVWPRLGSAAMPPL